MSMSRFTPRAHLPRSFMALALAAMGFASSAFAGTHTEVGDAGQLVGTAQSTVGTGPLTDIFGSISGTYDVDLYLINITDFASFSASTVNSGTDALLDTQLFLLTAGGKAVCVNDNALGGFQSVLGGGSCSGLGNGQYLLGIGSGYYDAVDGNNVLLFAPGLDTAVRGANSTFALAGYTDNGAFDPNLGAYDIQLTGASAVSAVPEPASLALMLGGLAVCGIAASRRQRASTKTSV